MAKRKYDGTGMYRNVYKAARTGLSAYMRYRRYRSAYNTRSGRKRISSGKGVTNQYDRALIYRKRRMPGRMRRRWMRFSKKVQHVAHKSLGAKTCVFNDRSSFSSDGSVQAVDGVVLYGANSATSVNGYRDLSRIKDAETASGTSNTSRFLYQSAILDLTCVNTGNGKIELDVYELWHRKVCDGDNYGALFSLAEGNTTKIGGLGSALLINQLGVTPFDLPNVFQVGGMYIKKKTKYFLEVGETMTYQIRDPKNRSLSESQLDAIEFFSKPGWTKGLYMIAKAVPGTTVELNAVKVDYGVTRKYMYKLNEESKMEDEYNPS